MAKDIPEINTIGLKCPLPVLRLEKAARAGLTHFIIKADDPISVIDIPLALQKLNGTLLSQSQENGVYSFEISLKIA